MDPFTPRKDKPYILWTPLPESRLHGNGILAMDRPAPDKIRHMSIRHRDSEQSAWLPAMGQVLKRSIKTIAIMPAATPASFAFSPTTPGPGQTVQFADTTSGGPTSWQWDFGDGSTSNAKNPSHVFLGASSYTVKLVSSGKLRVKAGKQDHYRRICVWFSRYHSHTRPPFRLRDKRSNSPERRRVLQVPGDGISATARARPVKIRPTRSRPKDLSARHPVCCQWQRDQDHEPSDHGYPHDRA